MLTQAGIASALAAGRARGIGLGACCESCASGGTCESECVKVCASTGGGLGDPCLDGGSGSQGTNSFRTGWICGGSCGGGCNQCKRVKKACGCGACQSCRAAADVLVDADGTVLTDRWGNPLRTTMLDRRAVGAGALPAKKPEKRIGLGAITVTTSAMSVAGAVVGGVFGWWAGGKIANDAAGQTVGAAAGALTGLVLF